MWNLMNNINKQNRNRLINTENRLMVARDKGLGGEKGEGIEVQIDSYKIVMRM